MYLRVRPRECIQKSISKLAFNTESDIQSSVLFSVSCAGSNIGKHHLAETKAVLY